MKARCFGAAVLALALLLVVAPAALAKGASAATIRGPGLERPISLRGLGEPGTDTRLANLADQTGLFAVMFGDTSAGELSDQPPAGDLGPRYTITYAVPGDNGTFPVVQELYPYAAGGPVTHAQPGQRLWGGQAVVGGWFRGPATLLPMLKSLGLPSRAPATASAAPPATAAPSGTAPAAAAVAARDRGDAVAWWAGGGAAGGVLLLGAAGLAARSVRRRRRAAGDRAGNGGAGSGPG
jgi:hypothetical protein